MQIPKDKNMKFAIKGTDFLKKGNKIHQHPKFQSLYFIYMVL